MEVLEAIKKRRSIRQFKPDPINDSDLNTILEAARMAPSWANTQCWRFIIVKDVEIKSKLADTCSPGNRGITAIKQAPLVIVACAELGKSGYFHGKAVTDKGDWYMFDVALALQNLTLAAYALGLGTLHVGFFDSKQAAQIVETPPDVAVVELMPIGYPLEEAKPTTRKELKEIVYHEKWENLPK